MSTGVVTLSARSTGWVARHPGVLGSGLFGGPHIGITMFVMGDGRVVPIQNSLSGTVLGFLSCRNDGQVTNIDF